MNQKIILVYLTSLLSIFTISSCDSQELGDPYQRREAYLQIADSLMRRNLASKAVSFYEKAAGTDTDTLLVAAQTYYRIYYLTEGEASKAAATRAHELWLQSVAKYPDNMEAYLWKLKQYEYSPSQGDPFVTELIENIKKRFPQSWRAAYALASHQMSGKELYCETDTCKQLLKQTLELNPSHLPSLISMFNSTQATDSTQASYYLKELYEVAPKIFKKNLNPYAKNRPCVMTISMAWGDSTATVHQKYCKQIGLAD